MVAFKMFKNLRNALSLIIIETFTKKVKGPQGSSNKFQVNKQNFRRERLKKRKTCSKFYEDSKYL